MAARRSPGDGAGGGGDTRGADAAASLRRAGGRPSRCGRTAHGGTWRAPQVWCRGPSWPHRWTSGSVTGAYFIDRGCRSVSTGHTRRADRSAMSPTGWLMDMSGRAWKAYLGVGLALASAQVMIDPDLAPSSYGFVAVAVTGPLAMTAGIRRKTRHGPWLLLLAGVAAMVAGDVLWVWYELVGRDPFPGRRAVPAGVPADRRWSAADAARSRGGQRAGEPHRCDHHRDRLGCAVVDVPHRAVPARRRADTRRACGVGRLPADGNPPGGCRGPTGLRAEARTRQRGADRDRPGCAARRRHLPGRHRAHGRLRLQPCRRAAVAGDVHPARCGGPGTGTRRRRRAGA